MFEIHITFGSTVKDHSLRTVEKNASQTFGGFTLIDGNGGWVNDSDELVEENSRTLVVRGESEDLENTNLTPAGWAKASARHLKLDSDEEAIMWDVRQIHDGGMV